MRRRLGAFAHFFGIRPWELDLLSPVEFEELNAFLDDIGKASR